MNTNFARLLAAFESHSLAEISSALDAGIGIHAAVDGKLAIDYLIEMYFRSDAFPDCLRLLLDRGARMDDRLLRATLLNDVAELESQIAQSAIDKHESQVAQSAIDKHESQVAQSAIDKHESATERRTSVVKHRLSLPCAFTPLVGATLLHVAAEYGNLAIARKLIELGADVNATADVDEEGYNGHTPLFHTVNSNQNRSAPVMRLLLEAGARSDIALPGIIWGKGFEWQTACFDVTPISYAQLGLLPQMQRTEQDTYDNIKLLLAATKRIYPSQMNVPNRYLQESP
jgi:Ankyrin repeat